jgi:nucleosome assembly protein 1-like 1
LDFIEAMSGSLQVEKNYPKLPEDIESEKEIIEEIKKLTPLSLKLKAFALNHHTLKLKEIGTQEEEEIDQLNIQTQKSFQQNIPNINDIINALRSPTDEELKDLDQYLSDEEKSKKDELLANLKPIENYWLTVLKNDTVIKGHINENDEKALKHLTKIEYKFSEDAATPHNFTITMHFTPNDYFTNDVLTVLFHMKESRDVTKTEGTQIAWKEGHNFTKKQVTKKQKNKKTGNVRTVTKEETVPSFFNLFNSIVAPAEDKELDEEESELQNAILDQVDIGYSLIEEAIPFSLEYFLGVRKDEYGDDEDFEDEDDDDEDDEEEAKPKGKKGGKAAIGGAGAAGAGGKQECKQQ